MIMMYTQLELLQHVFIKLYLIHITLLITLLRFCRSEFETFRQKQTDMENRSLAVIFLSFVFACLALAKLSIGVMSKFCRFYDFEKFHNVRSGWVVLLLSSCIVSTILIIQ